MPARAFDHRLQDEILNQAVGKCAGNDPSRDRAAVEVGIDEHLLEHSGRADENDEIGFGDRSPQVPLAAQGAREHRAVATPLQRGAPRLEPGLPHSHRIPATSPFPSTRSRFQAIP